MKHPRYNHGKIRHGNGHLLREQQRKICEKSGRQRNVDVKIANFFQKREGVIRTNPSNPLLATGVKTTIGTEFTTISNSNLQTINHRQQIICLKIYLRSVLIYHTYGNIMCNCFMSHSITIKEILQFLLLINYIL